MHLFPEAARHVLLPFVSQQCGIVRSAWIQNHSAQAVNAFIRPLRPFAPEPPRAQGPNFPASAWLLGQWYCWPQRCGGLCLASSACLHDLSCPLGTDDL